jgi:hypothetical protein
VYTRLNDKYIIAQPRNFVGHYALRRVHSLEINYREITINLSPFVRDYVRYVHRLKSLGYEYVNVASTQSVLLERDDIKSMHHVEPRLFPENQFAFSYFAFVGLYDALANYRRYLVEERATFRTDIPVFEIVKLSFVRRTCIVLFADEKDHTYFTFAPGSVKVAGIDSKKAKKLLTTRVRMIKILQAFLIKAEVFQFTLRIYGFSSQIKKLLKALLRVSESRIQSYGVKYFFKKTLKPQPFEVPFVSYTRPEIHHAIKGKKKRRIKRKIVKKILRKNSPGI